MLLSAAVNDCLLKLHLLPWSSSTLALLAAASTDASAAASPPNMPGMPCRLLGQNCTYSSAFHNVYMLLSAAAAAFMP
jgi:hypothetical protein